MVYALRYCMDMYSGIAVREHYFHLHFLDCTPHLVRWTVPVAGLLSSPLSVTHMTMMGLSLLAKSSSESRNAWRAGTGERRAGVGCRGW